MAISVGAVSEERQIVKRFVGVGAITVLAVNPSKKDLEAIYQTDLTSDPIYIGTGKVQDREVASVRLDFIVKNEETGMITKIPFFIKDSAFYNGLKTKVQMINKYGETCWLTIEDAKAGNVPEWMSPDGLRASKIGEDSLVNFLKVWANVKNRVEYNTKKEIANLKEAECMIENMDAIIKGNYKELQSYVKPLKDHKVKCLFGVKISDDGKIYQDVFTGKFAKNGSKNYDHIEKELVNAKERNNYSSTIFEICAIKEFEAVAKTTDFKQDADTFAGAKTGGSESSFNVNEGDSDLPF